MSRRNPAATLDALARTASLFHGRRDAGRLWHLFAGVLMALFVLTVLLALVAGVQAYGAIVARGHDQDLERLSSALIANTVMGNDYAGAVSVGPGPEGDALVLTRTTETGSYQTRLYRYQGALLQDFVLAGAAYDPFVADELFPTEAFSFTVDGSLVTVTTDAGSVCVDLRASRAGAIGGAA